MSLKPSLGFLFKGCAFRIYRLQGLIGVLGFIGVQDLGFRVGFHGSSNIEFVQYLGFLLA